MALTIGNHYASPVSLDGTTCTYYFYAEWWGNTGIGIKNRYFTFTGGSWNWTPDTSADSGWWYTSLSGNPSGIAIDINMTWYPWLDTYGEGDFFGSTVVQKTISKACTASAPSVASITSSSASVSCNFYPNVTVSTTSAQLQYKRTVDSTWINFGSPKTDGTGYSETAISSISLTGLTSSTSYDVRLVVTRTTIDNTTTTSATTSFNTLVGEPEITTDAASSVAANTATLNSTLTIGAGTGVTVYWKWGTDNPPTQNTTASQNASGSGSFQQNISSLTGSTTYYAQAYTAFSTPTGSPNNGSVVSFTTAADPAVEAANEDHMHIYEYDGKYKTQSTFYFTLSSPAATSSDRLVTTAPGSLFASGDVKISIDGGAFANASNSVAQVAASNPLYSLTLTAAEMEGTQIVVQIVDQNGPAFRDAILFIRTKMQIGQIDVDASQIGSSASALSLTPSTSGWGISGTLSGTGCIRANTTQAGGASTATLDASASATNDYYNGTMLVITSGTGIGQARLIIDYDGTSKVATVHRAWSTNPATSGYLIMPVEDIWTQAATAELTAIPTATSSWADKLEFLWQRFAYKRTQTATTHTMFKADSSTSLGTAAVSDNGTTQSFGKLS